MFTNITYKKKVIYAAIMAILLLFASFKKNIKKVIQFNKELRELQLSQLEDKDFNTDISYLKQEIKTIEGFIGGVNVSPEQVQQQLIKFISNAPLDLKIIGIERIHFAAVDQFNILSNQVTISGDYNNLIRLLHEIERDFDLSKMTNARFYTKNDYRNNRKELFLEILFQNYDKI